MAKEQGFRRKLDSLGEKETGRGLRVRLEGPNRQDPVAQGFHPDVWAMTNHCKVLWDLNDSLTVGNDDGSSRFVPNLVLIEVNDSLSYRFVPVIPGKIDRPAKHIGKHLMSITQSQGRHAAHEVGPQKLFEWFLPWQAIIDAARTPKDDDAPDLGHVFLHQGSQPKHRWLMVGHGQGRGEDQTVQALELGMLEAWIHHQDVWLGRAHDLGGAFSSCFSGCVRFESTSSKWHSVVVCSLR